MDQEPKTTRGKEIMVSVGFRLELPAYLKLLDHAARDGKTVSQWMRATTQKMLLSGEGATDE